MYLFISLLLTLFI